MKEETRKKKQERFVKQCEVIHESKYDYSKVHYYGQRVPVVIICPVHGDFLQTPQKHKIGQGCIKCSKGKLDTKTFIEKAKNRHGNKYSYDETEYVSYHRKLRITCRVHGSFSQRAGSHLEGYGCSLCARNTITESLKLGTHEFVRRSLDLHGDRYDYSKTNYNHIHEKVTITCKEHGDFQQTPDCHLKGYNCPSCSGRISQHKARLADLLESEGLEIIRTDRNIIKPYEVDIYLPEKRIAIEVNGIYWHAEINGKGKNYYRNKHLLCSEKGIKLISMFEDEWLEKRDVVVSVLKNKLGLSEKGIPARKSTVKRLPPREASLFYERNHLQGRTRAKIHLGCFYEDTLIAVMSFGHPTRQSRYQWELRRYATDGRNHPGVASKLLMHFIRHFNPKSIVSFSDSRWSDGNLYRKLGFREDGIIPPDYYYVKQNKRYHKSIFRKSNISRKFGISFDGKSAREIMEDLGFSRIWDCGKTRFVWDRQ